MKVHITARGTLSFLKVSVIAPGLDSSSRHRVSWEMSAKKERGPERVFGWSLVVNMFGYGVKCVDIAVVKRRLANAQACTESVRKVDSKHHKF